LTCDLKKRKIVKVIILENKIWYKRGLRDGVPIALGYFAVAVSCCAVVFVLEIFI